ncbi:hypothetical protein OAT84_02045 [Gammaproteobacteria bacterium]|nr:hypothetical protein [Gammaproteobacteria bacterium]
MINRIIKMLASTIVVLCLLLFTPLAGYIVSPVLPYFGLEVEGLKTNLWQGSVSAGKINLASKYGDIKIHGLELSGIRFSTHTIDLVEVEQVEMWVDKLGMKSSANDDSSSSWGVKKVLVDKAVLHIGRSSGAMKISKIEYKQADGKNILSFTHKGKQHSLDTNSKYQILMFLIELKAAGVVSSPADLISGLTDRLLGSS